MLQIQASGERCLCDFTFDFYWQHQGSRFDPDRIVSGASFRRLVEALREGETIRISGDVGSRLGSSMGVDLLRLGGKGGPIEGTGRIIVDGNSGNRLGISMLRGAIYVSGRIEAPFGNVVEAESDMTGYRKFVSATEALEKSIDIKEPNRLDEKGLVIRDNILRDTLGARNVSDRTIRLLGDAGMSTGILMRSGTVEVVGDADQNTGVLMQGGRLIVRGSTGDFTGAEMRDGEIFVKENAGSFACARMRGGVVYAKEGKPLLPAKAHPLSSFEQKIVARVLQLAPIYAMMYRKFIL